MIDGTRLERELLKHYAEKNIYVGKQIPGIKEFEQIVVPELGEEFIFVARHPLSNKGIKPEEFLQFCDLERQLSEPRSVTLYVAPLGDVFIHRGGKRIYVNWHNPYAGSK